MDIHRYLRSERSVRRVRRQIPDSYFLNYASTKCNVSQNAWVVCQFAKDPAVEHLLAVGDENGFIHFLDVQENVFKGHISADRSCIIDVSFVAKRPNTLLSISGHAQVTAWDIERETAVQQFVGHDGSVRALSISDDNPDLFATGARDGTICIWDQRVQPTARSTASHQHNIQEDVINRRPYNVLENTHLLLAPERQSIGMKRRSRVSISANCKGVTSLVHLGENTLISASSSSKTGIRFWDLRYRGKTGPYRILEDPNAESTRDFGIASICLDRFSSSLFAASTESRVYHYSIQGAINTPVGILQGVKRNSFNTYDFRIACSPTSDHVMFGAGDTFAVIWDLQEKYLSHSRNKMTYFPYPKYVFGGHRFEVTVSKFSPSGRYIATMDDSFLKIWEWRAWSPEICESSPVTIHQDRVEFYELPETAMAEISMKQLNVSASTPNRPECQTPKKNPERSPFKSPFKSPLNRIGTNAKNESGCESPVKKIYKYPTMNLPDFVRDRLGASISQTAVVDAEKSPEQDESGPPSSPDRPSNCSNMISMKERMERTSPRKIHVKQRSRKSRESATRLSMPKEPTKPRSDSIARSGNRTQSKNPSPTAEVQMTPASKKKTGAQRTLDQYFSKTPRTC